MGLFDVLKGVAQGGMDQGVEEFKATEGAVLLDVRTPQEYRGGHVPGSVNVPLQSLGSVAQVVPGKDTPVFVYCQSGGRSSRAASELVSMGYTQVRNIGGIMSYRGEMEY